MYDKHTNADFLDFITLVAKTYPPLKLHIVADNYATEKHPNVKAWLARNPRITMHFTPTSRSWLNNRRLERTLPPVHLDQNTRSDPRQGPPQEDFEHATSVPQS